MSIGFQEIPSDNLVPIFATEFDNSMAAKSGAMPWKNLLIGQTTNAKAPSEVTQIFSDAEADSLFGQGSQIALMAKAFRKNAKEMELYCLALQDADDASAATGTITVECGGETDTQKVSNESSPLYLTIAGKAVTATVLAGDNAKEIAQSIKGKVDSIADLPVTATVAENVVTLTAKNKGAAGNKISVIVNFNAGERSPANVSVTLPETGTLAGGQNDAVCSETSVGAKIAGVWYNGIVLGIPDDTSNGNVSYLQGVLEDRWSATVQQTGVVFYAATGKLTDVTTSGNARNSQVVSIFGLPKTPTQPCELASACLGVVAKSALADPAVPLSNWAVSGVVAPKASDRLILAENNAILKAGVSLLTSSDDGTIYLRRCVTTYKRNASGVSDTSYQQLEKIHTLSFLRWDWNSYLSNRYPHAKLADDGNEYGPGQVVMTPSIGKAELLTRYRYWMDKGLVQNYEGFANNLVVERDPSDETAMNFLIPADLIDQLLICKSKIQFR